MSIMKNRKIDVWQTRFSVRDSKKLAGKRTASGEQGGNNGFSINA
jgi:hypothetical protein